MKILFLAAVDFELAVARSLAGAENCRFVCSGMGPEATRTALSAALAQERFDLAVDLGVAGSYDSHLFPVGSVVQVVTERMGDRPERLLLNPQPPQAFAALPQAAGHTVPALDDRFRTAASDVETMEGAAFFEVCLASGVPFAEIRAVSNAVGEQDRSLWNIPLALRNLQACLQKLASPLLK